MTALKPCYLLSTGSYVPEKVLSNEDLSKMVDTNDEWITTRTGIKERRIAKKGELTSHMGVNAAKIALQKAQMTIDDIDMIVVATSTPDYPCPSAANIIQDQLNAKHIGAMDVSAACTGFIYGLSVAKAYVESGLYQNVLLIASERLSDIVDYEDRGTCILFGDGAGAAILSNQKGKFQVNSIDLGSDGCQAEILFVEGGGGQCPASKESIEQRKHFLKMNGREVFKHAVRRMEASIKTVCEKEGIKDTDIDFLVPHQANVRILDALAERFSIPLEKVYKTVHKYGNTSASAIIIALDEMLANQEVKSGDKLMLVAFGAGLTWGAGLLSAV